MSATTPVSIGRLAALHQQVETLRGHLCKAYVEEGPRLEMEVYTSLRSMLESQLRALYSAVQDEAMNPGPAQGSPEGVEARVVSGYYMQDVLAAALLLTDEGTIHDHYTFTAFPSPPPPQWNESMFYVSEAERQYCAEALCFLCFTAPSHVVIQALYPLLDVSVIPAGKAPDAAEKGGGTLHNQIAPGVLAHERFHRKRHLIAKLLNGVVLSRPTGVRALVRVLLLDDRVESGTTMDAAQCIIRVLTSRMRAAWWVRAEEGEEEGAPQRVAEQRGGSSSKIVELKEVPLEEQVQCISAQLVGLFEEHADGSASADDALATPSTPPTPRHPSFLKKLQSKLLPQETLEERLHICLVMLANRMLSLPARGTVGFSEAYKCFFYFNKYFLSPAFAALSLRSSAGMTPPLAEERAHLSLRRLLTLLKGSEGTASSHALLTVLEVVAPGLLSLSAAVLVEGSTADNTHFGAMRALLCSIWRSLWAHQSYREEMAMVLVRGCATRSNAAYVTADNIIEPHLMRVILNPDSDEASTQHKDRLQTLVAIVFGDRLGECPAGLQSAVVQAMMTECQTSVVRTASHLSGAAPAVGGDAELAHTDPLKEVPILLSQLEDLCVALPADAIFGTQATPATVLDTLSGLAPLSSLCLRWVVSLTPRVLQGMAPLLRLPNEESDALSSSMSAGQRGGILRSLRTLGQALQNVVSADGLVSLNVAGGPLEEKELQQLVSVALEAISTSVRAIEDMTTNADPAHLGTNNKHEQHVLVEWETLVDRAALQLESQAIAPLCVTIMRLSTSTRDAALTIKDPAPLRPLARRMACVLLRVLYAVQDVCTASHAVQCLVWLGMYRFDSSDTSLLAEMLHTLLLTHRSSMGVVGRPSETERALWVSMGFGAPPGNTARDRVLVARIKVRLLDVVLSWCDYDEDGRTLRHVDDYFAGVSERSLSLYDALALLCRGEEEPVVQVAALHCVGNYVVSVYPRVTLSRVCGLCRDVFRHTSIEMAKAACASMLGRVAATLCSEAEGDVAQMAGVDELKSIAGALSSYRSTRSCSSDCSEATDITEFHDEVVRRHGHDILQLLRSTPAGLFSI